MAHAHPRGRPPARALGQPQRLAAIGREAADVRILPTPAIRPPLSLPFKHPILLLVRSHSGASWARQPQLTYQLLI